MRIATLNINGFGSGSGRWPERAVRIQKALSALAPDLVLLQAVARDPETTEDQAAQIARLTGFAHCEFRQAEPTMLGVALLARTPTDDTRTLPLHWEADTDDQQRRVLLLGSVDWNGSTTRIATCHFSWVPRLNARHVSDAVASIDAFAGPAIIAGDMNATPDSTAIGEFTARGWVDAWAKLHDDNAGTTFPANQPTMRIDYFWLSPTLSAALKSVEKFGEDPLLSDHLGLVATFTD